MTARQHGKMAAARAKARRQVWDLVAARHGAVPGSRTCYGDLGEWVVIRLDATIQVCHSDKEAAAGTFKGIPADRVVRQHRRVPGHQAAPRQCGR
ncbi:hypothetical protein [Nonomuraea rosea]|uniref:hypothetical protein n=1 Tax=Nonomuraea rosea TaxID=638574 RepID=UPI0031EC27DA